MKRENREFKVIIPKPSGMGIAETITVSVPVEWDKELGIWLMTRKGHKIIDQAKREGILRQLMRVRMHGMYDWIPKAKPRKKKRI